MDAFEIKVSVHANILASTDNLQPRQFGCASQPVQQTAGTCARHAHRKEHCEHGDRDAHGAQHNDRIEVHIGEQVALEEVGVLQRSLL